MAGVAIEEGGAGRSFEGVSTGQQQPRCQTGEALAEWRSLEQVENGSPSTSPPYWDSDDDDDGGPKPPDLYGKYTWKIDKFSQINKRELRSNAFEVGGYKWYILIYPQGCDVCNHLSLFLCVANHDKLLPGMAHYSGWSHFAQFTIAVVNKDPKKSKYSDTLHRFWKKEHDWGWKKFMELSKVLDGFIDADTLIIKAQVQVIRERADRPFRCLDCQYRRELIRVYLTNVEQICRRFVEERRTKLGKLLEDKARWSSFCAFWLGMDQSSRRRMSREKSESILKVVVKQFFIEKEVTSTLVMDSLYSGLKALEGQNKGKKSKGKYLEAEELPIPIVGMEKDTFILVDDVLLLLERAAMEPLPPKDEKGPQNRTKDGTVGEEFNKDSIERDERRLTELGRRTIEIFVLAHIFSKIEVAYQEAVSLKKQEELIREEEAAWLAEIEQKSRRGIDKEKKSKKKQGKQKKNNRKGKDKVKDDKTSCTVHDKIEQEIIEIAAEPEIILEKTEAVEDASDASDSVDGVPEILLPDSDDRDVSPVNWVTDTSEVHPPIEAIGSATRGLPAVQNGTDGRALSAVDDSSSTCSSDSVLSVRSGPQRGNSCYDKIKNQKSATTGRNNHSKKTSSTCDWVNEELRQPFEAVQDARNTNDASQCPSSVDNLSQTASRSFQEKVRNGNVHEAGKKVEETGSMHKISKAKDAIEVKSCGDSVAHVTSSPKSPSNGTPLVAPVRVDTKSNAPVSQVLVKKPSSDSPKQTGNTVLSANLSENTPSPKPVPHKFASLRPADKPAGHQKHVTNEKIPTQEVMEPPPQKVAASKPAEKPSVSGYQKPVGMEKLPSQEVPVTSDKPSIPPIPVVSRPLSAPLVAGPRPVVSMVSMVQTAPVLARSVSAAGRLGPESTAYGTQSYLPQSYRNAMMVGPLAGSSSTYSQNHSATSVVNPSHSYSQAPTLGSAPLFSQHSSDRMDTNPTKPSLSFGILNHHDNVLQNGSLWMDRPQRGVDGNRNIHGDHNSLANDLHGLKLNGPMHSRSQEHLPSEYPACTSGRLNHHVLPDEFPHLDIINDLLDDGHGVGLASRANSDYQMFSSSPHHINRQYTFPGDPSMSSGAGPSASACRFDRTRSYHDDGYQHSYGVPGRSYDTLRDMVSPASSRPYVNGHVDSYMASQWQMGSSDAPLLRNMDSDGYPYNLPEYQNLSVGMNGYAVFRPSSNGL
ncbi:TNF receptor-associated factor homolog 1a-like isoform X1 [Salvia hispanica]|uniref:TNF receptor-associated factor homolog 1a-like isoform X1 n=1 Tax=Salvia hispanica TaxID=49212 RepID=UPI0020094DE7|nr:TNF receptor-associated factor homolog 1a-like isoform X1 [Salvia hispanica]XP_047955497.1 TNF receptor-associated factor homolog 1a-like isoform X1 [Salvia hispanica]XP_047955498.1 TNF receptor-associated factor homolog 1a-like isoform X1 [Salvia hispanica]XP_047955499.1 TNF receptor-associated factor homolog 1a-like isoform X1 [Salvia hispanica]